MPGRRRYHYGKAPHKPRPKWLSIVFTVAGVGVVLAIAGFVFAAQMEERDSFCASCHTQPESTYYQRRLASSAVDLASFHEIDKGTLCIDCHSGQGTFGRMAAILEGSQNALAFYTHTAVQPSRLRAPLGNDHCDKCHYQVYQDAGFNNHFHSFLPRWQSVAADAALCVDCHSSHTTDGDVQIGYLNQTRAADQCQRCHTSLGVGG
jgi:hypothetical protein